MTVKPCCKAMKSKIDQYTETKEEYGISEHKKTATIWYEGCIAVGDVIFCPWCGKYLEYQ